MDYIQRKFEEVVVEFSDLKLGPEDLFDLIAAHVGAGQFKAARLLAVSAAQTYRMVEASQADLDGIFTDLILDIVQDVLFPEIEPGDVTLAEYFQFKEQADMAAQLLTVFAISKRQG